tara:strand:+ start:2410 stop:3414 length:1005 start_codon:yes stop_codon:yes gene_type:complete
MLKKLSLIIICFFLTSLSTVAFEDNKKKFNIKFKLNANLDDLVLNYCSTFDPYTINRLYSQKKIHSNIYYKHKYKYKEKFLVSIKKKPFNPNLFKYINKQISFKNDIKKNKNINFEYLNESKKAFVKTILPIISFENQKILTERSRLQYIKEYLEVNNSLLSSDIKFINNISKKYKFKLQNKHKLDIINDLLELVDIIPNSIVLAQAVNESGWGTSRFATEYNALFGEYTYDFSNGVVPLLREEGKKHLVKSFDSVNKSVQSYFNNLNSHHAYKNFRAVRKIMRKNNNFSNINLLVNELDSYAADENYIDTIISIINDNKLYNFDNLNYTNTQS